MRFASLILLFAACGSSTPAPAPTPTPAPTPPAAGGECVKSGCSGTMCVEPGKEMATTCEFKAAYACYATATCARQADSACGWSQTAELTACLANPPPM